MKRTSRIIKTMDGPIRVLGHLLQELRIELDKTAVDLQTEFQLYESGIKDRDKAQRSNIIHR